mmetsp:Transcript_44496/g.102711  ORF Transcript_44496/g.102711 Transcript_44496/m.102711 type:complete len:81 (-) Transcript_44496:97-339(-)
MFDKCCNTAHKVEDKVVGSVLSKEKAKERINEQLGQQMPAVLKPCAMCCGNVRTVSMFTFAVPADKRDRVKDMIEQYKNL